MAEYTDNLNLIKPAQGENYNVDVANTNNEIIDNAMGNKQDKIPGKGMSSNDFTNEYKRKIDGLQKIYKYKGSVTNYSDLDNIVDKSIGDVWNVTSQNKDYCWNETEWTLLGNNVDLSDYVTDTELEEQMNDIESELEDLDNDKVNKSGDTMTGPLNMQNNPIKFGNDGNIFWKEDGYGDKFRIIPYFGGEGSNNVLRVQSTTGGEGTDPTNWKDLMNVHADTGEIALPNNAFVPKYFQMVWGNSLTVATEVGGHGLIFCSNSSLYMFWIAGGGHDQLSANLIWGNDICNITMPDSEHINISTRNNDSITCSVLFFRNP